MVYWNTLNSEDECIAKSLGQEGVLDTREDEFDVLCANSACVVAVDLLVEVHNVEELRLDEGAALFVRIGTC